MVKIFAVTGLLGTTLFAVLAAAAQAYDASLYSPSHYVSCSTTQGDILINLYMDWAPIGVQHFLDLVNMGFYSNTAFYRTVQGFLTQCKYCSPFMLLYDGN
jgi:peptidyl-prolyl cis-trans isomerase A (cyclophilin A)